LQLLTRCGSVCFSLGIGRECRVLCKLNGAAERLILGVEFREADIRAVVWIEPLRMLRSQGSEFRFRDPEGRALGLHVFGKSLEAVAFHDG